MTVVLELPDYDGNALDVIWEDNASYTAEVFENDILIKANRQGLISMAKQMLYMAYNDLPLGSHIHYNKFFTKTESKYDLIIEKE